MNNFDFSSLLPTYDFSAPTYTNPIIATNDDHFNMNQAFWSSEHTFPSLGGRHDISALAYTKYPTLFPENTCISTPASMSAPISTPIASTNHIVAPEPISPHTIDPNSIFTTYGSDQSYYSDNSSIFSTPSTHSAASENIPLPPDDYDTTSPIPDEIYAPPSPTYEDDDKSSDYSPYASSPRSTYSTPRRSVMRRSISGGRKAQSESPVSQRVRATPYSTPSKKRRVVSAPPSPRKQSQSRVVQVEGEMAELIWKAIKSAPDAMAMNGVCPEPSCGYVCKQASRLPDFRRHLHAHLRGMAGDKHICKGITNGVFSRLSKEAQDRIKESDVGEWYEDERGLNRIGGCLQTFSRADALTRHVKSKKNGCVGMVSGKVFPEFH